MPIHDLKAQIARLPEQPGIYMYSNRAGETIYVGKARSLRDRVRSYLGAYGTNPKTDALLDEADRLEVIVTDSVVEALALENNVIKQRSPRYNVLLRDDKKLPVPAPHPDRDLPAHPHRPARGPRRRPLFRAVPAGLAGLQDHRPHAPALRDPVLPRGAGRAPCATVPRVRHQAVHRTVRRVHLPDAGLRARHRSHQALPRRAQRGTAGGLAAADAGRRRGGAIRAGRTTAGCDSHRRDPARPQAEDGEPRAGRPGCHRREAWRRGRHRARLPDARGTRHRPGGAVERGDVGSSAEQDVVEAALQQFYEVQPPPPEVHVPVPPANVDLLEEWLSSKAGRRVRIVTPQRGEKRALLDLALRNAALAYETRFNETGTAQYDALETLRATFGLPRLPRRIDCFDISTIQGSETVASMVVCENGRMRRSEYRKFRVRGDGSDGPGPHGRGPDDFASMEEVVGRRYRKVAEEDGPWPDLLLIDGGKGQLTAAYAALAALDMEHLVAVGIAKKEELIFTRDRDEPVAFPRESPASVAPAHPGRGPPVRGDVPPEGPGHAGSHLRTRFGARCGATTTEGAADEVRESRRGFAGRPRRNSRRSSGPGSRRHCGSSSTPRWGDARRRGRGSTRLAPANVWELLAASSRARWCRPPSAAPPRPSTSPARRRSAPASRRGSRRSRRTACRPPAGSTGPPAR